MTSLQQVRECAKKVTSKAQHVFINEIELENAAKELSKQVWARMEMVEKIGGNIEQVVSDDGFIESLLVKWDEEGVHYSNCTQEPDLTAQYILVLSAMNFCFWPGSMNPNAILSLQSPSDFLEKQKIQEFEYFDLASCLRDVILADKTAFDAKNLMKCNEETLFQWFKERHIPLSSERARLVREIGTVLDSHYNGKVITLIQKAEKSAAKLVDLVTSSFPGFRDHCIHPNTGSQMFFYKRAQIFVADIWGCFGGKGIGQFNDIHQLTMFADYRVPQILRDWNILQYSEELCNLVDQKKIIVSGSLYEIEIRGATIEVVEQLRSLLEKRHRIRCKSIEVDWLLWQQGEKMKDSLKPHHRTMTIYY